MLHSFLAWIEFDVNPIGWIYLFVAVPSVLVSVVRFIHYYPLIVATNDDEREQDLLAWCFGSLLWPITVALLALYWSGVGFARLVHVLWPIEVPRQTVAQAERVYRSTSTSPPKEFVRPMSQEEVNDLLDSDI